ncbi:hypothetical protein ONZ45_g11291 [Pleurotus djamor]|nr:hypothetical protein ONZ45_g11291 [Pleurotus djamor]
MVKRRLQANAKAEPSRKGSNGSQGQPGTSRTMAERVASYMNDPINPRKLSPDQDGMIITPQPPDYEGIERDGTTQCVFLSKHEMSMLVEAPGYPRTLPCERTLGGYVIKHVEGKGLGMFATRDFAYGDMIASERPLLIFPMQLRTVETSRGDPYFELEVMTLSEKVLEFALERMGEVNKKKFLALHNCRANEKDCPNLLGIWRTNSFGVDFKKGRGEPGASIYWYFVVLVTHWFYSLCL